MSQSFLLTLPALQIQLDELPAKGQLTLAAADYRRLFGGSDAQGRADNFARGHGCIAEAGPASLTFRKL